ncbi:hypothetical protein [Caenispirillum salinarum]|uniref:hypothetical protein n=1 Tax=Caenispirillum salinarum TaxID=859058 RepID=UPI0038514C45
MTRRPTTTTAAAAALLLGATALSAPALAADPGDYDVLNEDPGVDLDTPLPRNAPITDTTPEAPTSTTIDVDVGEAPEYEVTVEDPDDIPDVGDYGGAPDLEPDADGLTPPPPYETQIGESPSDLLSGRDDDTLLGRPETGNVPEFEITDPETDPLAPDVDMRVE